MPARRALLRGLLALAAAHLACAFAGPNGERPQQAAPAGAAQIDELQPETGELYIFNDSGRTLLASDQVVTDNGKKLASLPRQTYVALTLLPGSHLLKPDPPLWNQQLALNIAAGKRYYVVIAYKPERSWAAPLAGPPLLLREITEEEAQPLLREMKAH